MHGLKKVPATLLGPPGGGFRVENRAESLFPEENTAAHNGSNRSLGPEWGRGGGEGGREANSAKLSGEAALSPPSPPAVGYTDFPGFGAA